MRTHKQLKFASFALAAILLGACSGKTDEAPPVVPPASKPVAKVVVSGEDVALAPGKTQTFTAQALDAAGAPLTATITWRSSNEALATVSGGTVTAVALGQVQITATAEGVVSEARNVYVNPSQTTSGALTVALAAGEITREQALVYQVFELFNDPRLPARFRGTTDQASGAGVGDLFMKEVVSRLDTLSAENLALIERYLLPPSYWGSFTPASAMVAAASGQVGPRQRSRTTCNLPLSDWVAKDSQHFRIWYNAARFPGDSAIADKVSTIAETAYAELVNRYGFQPPLPDNAWTCDGGDARLDIYFMEGKLRRDAEGSTIPIKDTLGGGATPVFIELSRDIITPTKDFRAVITHEFMHAIQNGYANMGRDHYFWTFDSTANWAVDLLYPGDPFPAAFVWAMLEYADKPLFFPNGYCGPETDCANAFQGDHKMYGAYPFFRFLTNEAGPDAVSRLFTNISTGVTLEPLEEINHILSLTGEGGLAAHWGKFALSLWNQSPLPAPGVPLYAGWSGETLWNSSVLRVPVLINATSLPKEVKLPLDMVTKQQGIKVPELSSIYNRIDFEGDVRSVVFYNGFSRRMTMQDASISAEVKFNFQRTIPGGKTLVMYEPTTEQKRGRSIWALKKVNGTWLPPEDWTESNYEAMCLDKASQRVESLVLIFSNGNYTNSRDARMDDNAVDALGDEPSRLVASETPCWRYKGFQDTSFSYDDGTDNFIVTTHTEGTYEGQPNYSSGQTANGQLTVLWGWVFQPLPGTQFTSTVRGTMRSCNPARTLSETRQLDLENASFRSFLFPQTSAAFNTYIGAARAQQFEVLGCSGQTKYLPAVNPLNFNLDFTEFQTVDLTSFRLFSGAAGPDTESEVWHNGSYAEVPEKVTNFWCFAAIREGEPAPVACQP